MAKQSFAHKDTEKKILDSAMREINTRQIRQYSALRIYHCRKIKEIDEALSRLLQEDINGIDY